MQRWELGRSGSRRAGSAETIVTPFVVGADLGGTAIKVAAVGRQGELLARARRPTEVAAGRQAAFANLVAAVQEAARTLGPPAAIGLGVPGIFDAATGVVITFPNFPDWSDFPLQARLRDALSAPIVLLNDANAAALGEQWRGAAQGIRDFLFLTLGTGLGGGIVLGGALWEGPGGRAGEVGHMVVEPDGPPCGCGGRGCLETFASALGIARMLREAGSPLEAADDASVAFRAARAGDPVARGVVDRFARYLAIGIANVANLLDLRHVILGGGISAALDDFLPPLRAELRRRLFAIDVEAVSIRRAACGEDAGLLGAARAAWAAVA